MFPIATNLYGFHLYSLHFTFLTDIGTRQSWIFINFTFEKYK